MRGKRDYPTAHYWTRRIIPAHAGQTHVLAQPGSARPDHPRACGANEAIKSVSDKADGSSPRMRGKLRGDCGQRGLHRIIPAHAGQTA